MLSEKALENIADRLADRMEAVNIYTLETIGKRINEIGTANVTDLKKIINQIQAGGDIDKIMNKLAQMTKLNVKDIYNIFEEVAKINLENAEELYKYKNIKYIPYEENEVFQREIKALSRITAKEIFKDSYITAFTQRINGKIVQTPLSIAYQNLIDEAVISLEQGQDVFQNIMYKRLNDFGDGIKVVDYASGYTRRIDSAVRMNVLDAIRDINNMSEQIIGEELGANGIEITVHLNPAPDHAPIQGKQFSNEEFEKLQNNESFKDINGRIYDALERVIGQWNCYHTINNILIGVSKPQYNEKELEKINKDNEKGFEFEGKHYTNYQGIQLQRKLETEIRKQKDKQILGKASGNKELISKSQQKITALTIKYRQLCKEGKLQNRIERARVRGYHRIDVSKI